MEDALNRTLDENMTMDLMAEKITVLDLEDIDQQHDFGVGSPVHAGESALSGQQVESQMREISHHNNKRVCFSQPAIALLAGLIAFFLFVGIGSLVAFVMQLKKRGKL